MIHKTNDGNVISYTCINLSEHFQPFRSHAIFVTITGRFNDYTNISIVLLIALCLYHYVIIMELWSKYAVDGHLSALRILEITSCRTLSV